MKQDERYYKRACLGLRRTQRGPAAELQLTSCPPRISARSPRGIELPYECICRGLVSCKVHIDQLEQRFGVRGMWREWVAQRSEMPVDIQKRTGVT
jgi:hypothetical protein